MKKPSRKAPLVDMKQFRAFLFTIESIYHMEALLQGRSNEFAHKNLGKSVQYFQELEKKLKGAKL